MEYWDRRSRSRLLRRGQQSLFLYGSGRDTYAYTDTNRNAYANGNTHTYPNANPLAHRNANADADFSMHCS